MPDPPIFTAHLRGWSADSEPPWVESERLLRHEGSRAYRVADALRRLRGRSRGPRTTLPERRRALAEVTADPVYRAWVKRRSGEAPPAPATSTPAPPGDEVDRAIEVLRATPFQEIQRRGWHFQPDHFYWPLNDVTFLEENRGLWHGRGMPADIDWDLEAQRELEVKLRAYAHELDDVPEEPDPAGPARFAWHNNAFGGADALAYYGLVRELKPGRVIEVGCGWSSLLLQRAVPAHTQVTQVEPYPDRRLLDALPADWERHESILQHAPLELFESLEAGDVLFYDGSHCVHTASDVNWLFFEVLPRLAPGVWVHVHDVFFPDDYHDEWALQEGLSWNEQYLLQAFLMHNEAYKVRLANHMLNGDGGSVWIEKTASR